MQDRLLECECVVMQQTVYRDVLADAQVWKQAKLPVSSPCCGCAMDSWTCREADAPWYAHLDVLLLSLLDGRTGANPTGKPLTESSSEEFRA